MLKISKIIKNNIAHELGLKKGDEIVAFDGFSCKDVLDYLYYDSQNYFTLTVNRSGEELEFEIEKDEDESLGVVFENDNLEVLSCRNKCLFCFVDQMPKGMRPSLYLKDDDYRQSFLRGNFVTLTNVTNEEIDRIIRLNLSPLYVSVHVTDAEKRKALLGNRFAGDILDKLKKLCDGGIKVHTQIVLVPSVNDGAVLDNTCHDLLALGENVLSIAVVPCGITKYREGLFKIEDVDAGYSRCVIEQVNRLNSLFSRKIISLADEFYFKAKLPLPPSETYGDYPQIENGVGVTAKFLSEIRSSVKKVKSSGKFVVVSGTSAHGFISEQVDFIKSYIFGIEVKVLAVENEFFGQTVNCTGLLVGRDIINALKSVSGFDYLVLPDVCLRREESVFLDGVTLAEVERATGLKVIVTDGTGESFVNAFAVCK